MIAGPLSARTLASYGAGVLRVGAAHLADSSTLVIETGFGKRAVFIREGGSIPFVTQMYETFKVPCILLGFGLPDENAHAPDEHLSLENYYGGIKSVAHFYSNLATL